MLSILIPTYNYNVYPLACQLEQQALDANIVFEIICFDDGSKSQLNSKNNSINSLKNCTFKELSSNIGRSAIRNLLGKNAKYENLLFVDAGTMPKNENFIKTYLSVISKEVASGGMTNLEKKPEANYKLRWVYTKKRETKTFCSSNFIIKRQSFLNFPFDETLKQYGYEDVLFFETLKKNNIDTFSFNNKVVHQCDDDAKSFLLKTEKAICNLKVLMQKNKLNKDQSTIIKYYLNLKKIKLTNIIGLLFKLSKPLLNKNLTSKHASLLIYDAYRLGYLCSI